jgi:transcriptional regulator with XRE-family HTH domain
MTDDVSDTIVQRVKVLRRERGWSARELARRCAEAGAPELTLSVLNNIETGRPDPKTGVRRRRVTAEELMAFSRAFDVPPGDLMGYRSVRGMSLPETTERLRQATVEWQIAQVALVADSAIGIDAITVDKDPA